MPWLNDEYLVDHKQRTLTPLTEELRDEMGRIRSSTRYAIKAVGGEFERLVRQGYRVIQKIGREMGEKNPGPVPVGPTIEDLYRQSASYNSYSDRPKRGIPYRRYVLAKTRRKNESGTVYEFRVSSNAPQNNYFWLEIISQPDDPHGGMYRGYYGTSSRSVADKWVEAIEEYRKRMGREKNPHYGYHIGQKPKGKKLPHYITMIKDPIGLWFKVDGWGDHRFTSIKEAEAAYHQRRREEDVADRQARESEPNRVVYDEDAGTITIYTGGVPVETRQAKSRHAARQFYNSGDYYDTHTLVFTGGEGTAQNPSLTSDHYSAGWKAGFKEREKNGKFNYWSRQAIRDFLTGPSGKATKYGQSVSSNFSQSSDASNEWEEGFLDGFYKVRKEFGAVPYKYDGGRVGYKREEAVFVSPSYSRVKQWIRANNDKWMAEHPNHPATPTGGLVPYYDEIVEENVEAVPSFKNPEYNAFTKAQFDALKHLNTVYPKGDVFLGEIRLKPGERFSDALVAVERLSRATGIDHDVVTYQGKYYSAPTEWVERVVVDGRMEARTSRASRSSSEQRSGGGGGGIRGAVKAGWRELMSNPGFVRDEREELVLASETVRDAIRSGKVDDSGARVLELLMRRVGLSKREVDYILGLAGPGASSKRLADVWKELHDTDPQFSTSENDRIWVVRMDDLTSPDWGRR